jgi:hypothetical protein
MWPGRLGSTKKRQRPGPHYQMQVTSDNVHKNIKTCHRGAAQSSKRYTRNVTHDLTTLPCGYPYRKCGLCRAFKSLPCVFYGAHDKELFCCASFKTHDKESLSCILFYGARHKIFVVRFNFWCTTTIFFFLHSCNKRPLVFDVRRLETHDKDKSLTGVSLRRTTKSPLCRAVCYDARQRFFFKFWFLYFFLFLHYRDIICTLYFKFVHGSINLLLLKIMCHLKNYCRICQIWTTSAQSNGVKFVKKWYSCNWVLFKTFRIQLDVILNILFMNHESPHALDMFFNCIKCKLS